MSDAWVGVVKAAAPKYLKGAADLTVRRRLILSLLDARGLINLNYLGSHEEKFDVDYAEPPVEAFGDAGVVEYARRDYLKQGTIDWRGYSATDLMTLKEQEMTKGGDYVMVNRYKRIFPKLTQGVKNQIGLEFYCDGNATGNENRFCGVESFCGADTGNDAAGDIIDEPADTYCGLSTALNQGGRWSADLSTKPSAHVATDWPEGEGSSEYDYWSPKLVNWSSTAWTATNTTTWLANCEYVLRRTMQWLSLTAGAEENALYAVLAGALFTGFKDAMSSKQRILVPHKEADDLGFPQVLNFEGCGIHTEFGIPANTGYVLNVSQMELDILCDELIKSKGPDYDPDSASYKFLVYTFGNFKFMPKFVAKLYNYV